MPPPAWQWSAPLMVMALCLAGIGVYGWLDAANATNALQLGDWSVLAPLWPLHLLGAVGCFCAQFLAIGAARHMRRGSFVAAVVYIVCVVCSAYSLHNGVRLIVDRSARAEFELREHDRAQLAAEIEQLQQQIDAERRQLPGAGSVGPRNMMAAVERFDAATAVMGNRLATARAELATMPRLTREPRDIAWLFFLLIAWALMEPWTFSVDDQTGRGHHRDPARASTTSWLKATLAGIFSALAPLAGAQTALNNGGPGATPAAISAGSSPDVAAARMRRDMADATWTAPPSPTRRGATRRHYSREVIAGALARYHAGDAIAAICAEVGCHRSQIYRWLAAARRAPRSKGGASTSDAP